MTVNFKILGSGAGPGAPSFFCKCKGCMEAIQNPELARTRSGAIIQLANKNILIDTPPDLRVQLLREKIDKIDCVFLTHWHYDHFGGIGELEYYVKLLRHKKIPLFLPASATRQFEDAFPDLGSVFDCSAWNFDQKYEFDRLSLTPLPANHGVETAGFLVETEQCRLAYFPDTAGLSEHSKKKVAGVDWFICDATFCGDNWFPQAHMSVDEAIALGKVVKAKHTVLTHMSVHYSKPMTNRELKEELSQEQHVVLGHDGMKFTL